MKEHKTYKWYFVVVFSQGFYWWSAEVPALLQSLCSQHSPHPQLADNQLPVSQSGTPAEVRFSLSVPSRCLVLISDL